MEFNTQPLENPLFPLLENPLLEKVEQNPSDIRLETTRLNDFCSTPLNDFCSTPLNDFCSTFFKSGKSGKSGKCGNLMHLKIFVSGDYDLKKLYLAAAEHHNQKILNNKFIDAGFDLFTPLQKEEELYEDVIRCFGPGWKDDYGSIINPINKIDFKVKCSAKMYNYNNSNSNSNSNSFFSNSFYTGYFLYPRSSISKTPLRLANSLGIIDSGYRGNLMGMFDVVNINDEERSYKIDDADYYIKKYDKLVQICAPSLSPIFVEIVDTLDELGEQTERGEGGFGSTSTSTSTF